MIQELEMMVFTHDIPERGLKKGDVGAVVHLYKDHEFYLLSVGIGRSRVASGQNERCAPHCTYIQIRQSVIVEPVLASLNSQYKQ